MKSAILGQLELHHLVAFAAVARIGSFTAAAQSLGYTQSAVSQKVARLEKLLGHRLIDRSRSRSITLTPAGRIVLDHAEAVQLRLEVAIDDLAALENGVSGVLRVGCYESISIRILPRVLRLFAEQFPGITVMLSENEHDEALLDQVERGELDLTFVVFPMIEGPFESVTILEDPLVLVVSADSALAARTGPISVRDLVGLPLISYAQMREEHRMETRLGQPQLSKQIIFRSNHNSTILSLAAEGYGSAVLTRLSVDPKYPGISILPVEHVGPRIIGVAWHRPHQQSVQEKTFVQLAMRVAREVEQADF